MPLFLTVTLIGAVASAGTIDDALLERLSEAPRDEMVPVMVTMADPYPSDRPFFLAGGLLKEDARTVVISELKDHAVRVQRDLLRELVRLEAEDEVAVRKMVIE